MAETEIIAFIDNRTGDIEQGTVPHLYPSKVAQQLTLGVFGGQGHHR